MAHLAPFLRGSPVRGRDLDFRPGGPYRRPHGEGTGRSSRRRFKLNNYNHLDVNRRAPLAGARLRGLQAPISVRPDGFWSRPDSSPLRAVGAVVVFLFIAMTCGCGGAVAPCLTPTADLDRHRTESEDAQRTASRAASEARRAEAARAAAEARLAAARAAYDSLSTTAGDRAPGKRGK